MRMKTIIEAEQHMNISKHETSKKRERVCTTRGLKIPTAPTKYQDESHLENARLLFEPQLMPS